MLKDSIIFIVPSMKSGGLERVASVFLNTLVYLGYKNVTLINLSTTPSFYQLDETIICHNVDIQINNKNKLVRAILTRKWLRKIVGQFDSPTVLSFGEGYNAFVILSLFGINKDLYVTNRASPLSSLKGFRGMVNPFFYKYTKGVIVQTQLAKELLKTHYKKVNFYVLPNPIDIEIIPDSNFKKENIILNVGRIGGNKNQELLINYLQNIQFEKYDWQLNFIGDGPKITSLKHLIDISNSKDKVAILGTQNKIIEHYKRAKIFAFTSTSEGFPNVLLEAMSYGLPCISFDCTAGPADLIENGSNGFLIPMENHQMYEEKLLLLMKDQELWAKMSKMSLIKASNYDSVSITKQLVQIILSHKNNI